MSQDKSTTTSSSTSNSTRSIVTMHSTGPCRRWPAEYEPHMGCIILFPKQSPHSAYCSGSGNSFSANDSSSSQSGNSSNSSTKLLRQAQLAVLDVISAIINHGQENVYLFCHDEMEHQPIVVSYLMQHQIPFVVANQMKANAIDVSTVPQPQPQPQAQPNAGPLPSDTTTTDGIATMVIVMICPNNDTWARDTGPTFVFENDFHNANTITNTTDSTTTDSTSTTSLIGLDWNFNAYGGEIEGCYWPCTLDQQIASNMIQSLQQYCHSPYQSESNNKLSVSNYHRHHLSIQHELIQSLIVEGGAIHTDGEGTILTTRECLLNTNRNPTLSQQDAEQILCNATGCTKVIWLDYGLAHDDDTNGHVDNWACFVKPCHIVLSWTDDLIQDPINYQNCRHAYDLLSQSTDALNRSFVIHKLYLPSPPLYYSCHDEDDTIVMEGSNAVMTKTTATSSHTVQRVSGTPMAASYVNFYIANGAVIVPQFQTCPTSDAAAMVVLQSLFPDRKVVGIPSGRHILYGGGNIHCITQQIPK
jgi:agmatine deiminase